MSIVSRLAATFCLVTVLAACSGADSPQQPGPPETPPPPPLEQLAFSPLNRLPVPDRLRATDDFGTTAVAVGGGGAVVVRPVGSAWRAAPRGTRHDLNGVVLLDARTIVAVGADVIIRSEDQGRTWQTVAKDTGNLQAVDGRGSVVIAIGSGVCWFSTNGGRDWKEVAITGGSALRHVFMLGEKEAIALGSGGIVFRTTSAGESWAPQATPTLPAASITDVAFADDLVGVVAMTPVALHRTIDGGVTWNEVTLPTPRRNVRALDFSDADNGVLINTGGELLVSSDAGKSWAFKRDYPVDVYVPLDVSAAGSIVTVVGSEGFITEDIGLGFVEKSSGDPGDLGSIALSTTGVGLATRLHILEQQSRFLFSNDDGLTWSPATIAANGFPNQVVLDGLIGLILTREEVLRSSSGGVSWNTVLSGSVSKYEDAVIIDANTHVVCGSATLLRTTDGGANWVDVSGGTALGTLLDMDMFDGTGDGLLVGSSNVLRTTDGGATWTPVVSTVLPGGTLVATAGRNVAVAVASVGDETTLFRSTDGGVNWTTLFQANEKVRGLAFAGARRGLAVGDNGLVMESFDGGATWAETEIVAGQDLRHVVFVDTQTAFIAGSNGAVLRGLVP